MKRLSLYLLLGATLASCTTDVPGATKALERNNYKPLHVGGLRWFAGGQGDVYRTEFRAIAPNGDTVTGVVTGSYFKGSTIRLDD